MKPESPDVTHLRKIKKRISESYFEIQTLNGTGEATEIAILLLHAMEKLDKMIEYLKQSPKGKGDTHEKDSV